MQHGANDAGEDALPLMPPIDAQDPSVLAKIQAPVKRLYTDSDLASFQRSDAHRIFTLFVSRLAEASVGKPVLEHLPLSADSDAAEETSLTNRARRILHLLAELDRWTKEIEREQGPQRFGNIAFREWGRRLEERAQELHEKLLPPHLHPFIVELLSPFLSSFGNFTRIDYGSGHELSFAIWLCFLYRLNFFGTYDGPPSPEASDHAANQRQSETEQIIALLILPAYLRTVYALQDRYSLEPAGSHGVWGLDDFQFLPYVIGSAQLSVQEALKPRDILPPISRPPRLPNLYSRSIARILTLKHGGPFAEHSPMLTDIASSVPSWSKVLRGLLRMYEAEVLGKRVVVQLWDFGGVGWVWEGEIRESSSSKQEGAQADVGVSKKAESPMAPTAAPWASTTTPTPQPGRQIPTATGMPGFSSTAAPWASGASSSALGPRLGTTRPNPTAPPPPHPRSTPNAGFGASATSLRTSLYSTGSAAAASSPFGSLARSMAGPGRTTSGGTGLRGGAALRDPLANPDEP
ncbi:unnamed protein product [Tilletia controversa]|uniref:Serine/threonine-protein phosphatase 2A activator n=3 Tax=Tilletia TaxID=13289 RepID=A0A8X7MII9_9BASI|nr:hypothetical protein CF328_g8696 [Tilletia controversa]KAE8182283.1 hypothetical protein CF335_g8678 [Tilletia laevis]KAE8261310.1 hypothetical protein A4X03_0g3372 [Tilletia caries]KAE8193174.1 hypothetical protein CF336_g4108 [Tilletia laevis]KAE8237190.1 hypothetical protein A4X06_0g9309 [Tilletia controversa]